MKKILYQEFKITRELPINLNAKEINLFQHEFEKRIPKSYLLFEKNVLIRNGYFFNFKKIKTYTKYLHFNKINIKLKIKLLIKGLATVFNKKIVIFKGIWIFDNKSDVYFHFLIDSLSRAIMADEYKDEYLILIPESQRKDWKIELIEKLNFNYLFLDENKTYLIKNLIIPSYPAPSGNYNPLLLKQLIKMLLSNIDLSNKNKYQNFKRVWVDRSNSRRDMLNFAEIEPILKKFDFKVVRLEEKNLVEKILILQNIEWLIGNHGSGLTNMIFMKPDTNVLDIRDPQDSIKNAFFSLTSPLKINYYYLEREAFPEIIIDPKKLDNFFSKYL